MKKANIQKMEIIAADNLQYLWSKYIGAVNAVGKDDPVAQEALTVYIGATDMLQSMAIEWRRYHDGTAEQQHDISTYHHQVWFPEDRVMDHVNMDSYK